MVPFGLAQAPAYFQALISEVLKELSHFAIAYLDDIIIFSQTEEKYLKHLEIIFRRLKEAGLKLKRSKCSFNSVAKDTYQSCITVGSPFSRAQWVPMGLLVNPMVVLLEQYKERHPSPL